MDKIHPSRGMAVESSRRKNNTRSIHSKKPFSCQERFSSTKTKFYNPLCMMNVVLFAF